MAYSVVKTLWYNMTIFVTIICSSVNWNSGVGGDSVCIHVKAILKATGSNFHDCNMLGYFMSLKSNYLGLSLGPLIASHLLLTSDLSYNSACDSLVNIFSVYRYLLFTKLKASSGNMWGLEQRWPHCLISHQFILQPQRGWRSGSVG